MKTLIMTKSGGGFMKPILLAGAVVLLSLGATRPALADTAVELVSGTDIIFYDATTATLLCSINSGASNVDCSTFGTVTANTTSNPFSVSETLSASSFNGWDITSDNGTSYAPSCSATGVCEDQINETAVNLGGAAAALGTYFASSGFDSGSALQFSESSTALDGTANAMAYAYSGALGLQSNAGPLLPAPFSLLSLTGSGNSSQNAGPGSGVAPTAPYNLAAGFNFSPGTPTGNYSVSETISAAVPEPSSVSVLLVMLLGIAFVVRKLINNNVPATQTRTN